MKAEVDAKLLKEEIECRISELEICTNIGTNIGTTWCILKQQQSLTNFFG